MQKISSKYEKDYIETVLGPTATHHYARLTTYIETINIKEIIWFWSDSHVKCLSS